MALKVIASAGKKYEVSNQVKAPKNHIGVSMVTGEVKDLSNKKTVARDLKRNRREESDKTVEHIYKSYKSNDIDKFNAVNLLILEIKKEYVLCVDQTLHLDAETNKYLDEILFDKIIQLLVPIVTGNSSATENSNAETIKSCIKNSLVILDYFDGFDFDSMNALIDFICEVFM